MRTRGKALLGIGACAVAASCMVACRILGRDDGAAAGRRPAERPARPVAVETVRPLDEPAALTYPGTVRAARTARLSFRVGGPIVEVCAKPGDIVRRDAVLMRLDPRDCDSEVRAIRARLDAASARLDEKRAGAREEDIRAMEARLDAARARAANAELDHARAVQLLAEGVTPQAEFDRSESALAVAKAGVRDLEASLRKERAGARDEEIRALEAEMRGLEVSLQVALDRLEDTELRAPFDGVVTKQFAEAFEMVSPGTPVVGMHDISELEIAVDVPESELIHRSPHDTYLTTVTFGAIPGRTFEAAVKEWDTEADPLTRTYTVVLRMQAPEDVTLLPGMTAEVSARLVGSGPDAGVPLAVRAGAVVVGDDGEESVWVLPEGSRTAERRPVRVGEPCGPDRVTVLAGLRPGERVVTAGARYVIAGMPLRPVLR